MFALKDMCLNILSNLSIDLARKFIGSISDLSALMIEGLLTEALDKVSPMLSKMEHAIGVNHDAE